MSHRRDRPPAAASATGLRELLRVGAEGVDLTAVDPRATPGLGRHARAAAEAELLVLGTRLADLQERLYAEGHSGGHRSVLLVLQGMDTAGKGGTVRHVLGQVDPQGCRITAFGVPTAEERSHDFLWRIRRALPPPGQIGVFDRSHYEDVVAVRVHALVPRATWSRRYSTINRFESGLVAGGTRVLKCFLHISEDESRARLLARLDDRTKHWKFNPGDIDERAFWPAYQDAYSDALTRCSTDDAPWYVVPADRKWYRTWAITKLLLAELEALDPPWPAADFDVAAQRARLTAG